MPKHTLERVPSVRFDPLDDDAPAGLPWLTAELVNGNDDGRCDDGVVRVTDPQDP